MSNLVEHARRELELCGQTAEDPAYAESIVKAIEAFASYEHSGGSAFAAIEQITALLRFENLSPLTDDPAEWNNVSDISGAAMWQSRRNPVAFSEDGGRTYYLVSDDPKTTYETRRRSEQAEQTVEQTAGQQTGPADV